MGRSAEENKRRTALVNAVWRGKDVKGAFDPNQEGRQLLSTTQKQLGVDLPNRPIQSDGKPFYGTIAETVRGKPTDYAAYRDSSLGTGGFVSGEDFDRAVAVAYGVEQLTPEVQAQAYQQARGQQAYMGQVRNIGINATEEALRNVGGMFADGAVPDVVWNAMHLNEDKMRAVWGNAAADGFRAEVEAMVSAGKIKEAIEYVGIKDEQLKSVIPAEVNTPAKFEMPYLKDVPLEWHGLGMGAAAAGAGALAYHLMAQGQQQQSAADYNAVAQALAAY